MISVSDYLIFFVFLCKIRLNKQNLMNLKKILTLLFFSSILILTSFTTLESKKFKVDTIVIDAGHGGKDPGCHGKMKNEAEVSLKVALELKGIINEYLPDVKVILTRDDNKFVELYDRAGLANKNDADFFISIHCNAGPSAAYGTETYTMGLHNWTGEKGNLDEVTKRENSVILLEEDHKENYGGFDPSSPMSYILMANYQSAYNENSIRMAQLVESQFKNRVGRHSRGVKQKGLLVLWKSYMPSVLVEVGFLTNPTEEKFLSEELGQVYMASGIFRAFRDYKSEIESQN